MDEFTFPEMSGQMRNIPIGPPIGFGNHPKWTEDIPREPKQTKLQYNTIQYNNFYLNTINVLSVAALWGRV